jgi:hypothetical protein
MIQTNLATRPFYNERLVHLLLGLAAIVLLALTAYNGTTIYRLSRESRDLSAKAAKFESQARDFDRQANAIKSQLDAVQLKELAGATREANTLIDQRTFSWTELFNRIETTLPSDVMITSVRPDIKDGRVELTIAVVGRRVDDIDEFIEKLEGTGAFSGMLSRSAEPTDEGTIRAVLHGRYTPGAV